MRLKNLFGMAAMLALAASCSEKELVESGGTGANENGPHYATFTIKLPTTNGTRAAGDLTYDEGTANEYAVNNATLLIFQDGFSRTEKDATFVESVELGDMKPWTNVDDDAITTEANITAKLNNFKSDYEGNYYAVILLNNNMTGSDKKVKLPANGNTFSQWQKANITNSMTSTVNGFYMANATKVIATTTSTLVPIDKSKVTTTESAAQPAATIYVERGVGKVTMTPFSQMNVTGIEGDKVTITAWDLDVTNKKSYPVHNVDNYDSYDQYWGEIWKTDRFSSGHSAFNRAHWGIDPNYSNVSNDKEYTDEFNYNYKARAYDFSNAGNASAPKYCLENTFSLGHMYQNQTTRVIMKATYIPKGLTEDETFYMIDGKSGYFTDATLKTQIETAITNAGYTAADFKVSLNALKAAGKHIVAAGDITKVSGTQEVDATFLNKVNAQLGLSDEKKISTYKEGVSYYIARIKHFGDGLTPWPAEDGNKDTYGTGEDAKKRYLGRYGVVRNNWYELTVNKVTNPGSPDVPTVTPDTPDDEGDKYYVNCTVKILSWAKRVQNIEL